MSHSLHRVGSEESLKVDYVFLCTPTRGINSVGAAQKLIKILDILLEVGPANIGFYGHGSLMGGINIEDIKGSIKDDSRLRCCFDDKEKVKEVLKRIKSGDFGLSIAVSGPVNELMDMAQELSLKPHTINISCGIFGRIDRLPDEKYLEISTMCGHGMIGYRFINSIFTKLRTGEMNLDEAIQRLGEPCTCGIFNPSRAREILKNIICNNKTAGRLGRLGQSKL